MSDIHQLLQEMIDIVENRKKPSDRVYLANSKLDEATVREFSIPRLLEWLFDQQFPGDTSITKYSPAFSSRQVVEYIDETHQLQKYFQIKDGTLAFASGLKEEEAMEMIAYVKKHYKPGDVFLDFF